MNYFSPHKSCFVKEVIGDKGSYSLTVYIVIIPSCQASLVRDVMIYKRNLFFICNLITNIEMWSGDFWYYVYAVKQTPVTFLSHQRKTSVRK